MSALLRRPVVERVAELLASPAESGVGGGNAGIDRSMDEGGAQFGHGHAIAERWSEMELELLLAMQCCHHGERQQRACLARQGRIAPHLAPGGAGDELLPG